MDHEWGRIESAGTWLTTRPVWVLSAILLGAVSSMGIGQYRYSQWTPLERFYLSPYVRSTLLTALGWTSTGRYALLMVVDGHGRRMALDADVEPVDGITARGAAGPAFTFTVTREAAAVGIRSLTLATAPYDHRRVQDALRTSIYHDRGLRDLVWPPIAGGLGVLALALVVAVPEDAARARARRHGRRLKGAELVSPRTFTKRLAAHGIGWRQAVRPWSLSRRVSWVRIPRGIESSHVLMMGDTGTGKSALIRQLLVQIAARGETAIVYDPATEYAPQFYDPVRGDQILNPLDARSPFWTPADELRLDAEALTLAESLFPDRPNENSFFSDAPRRIMAFLLTQRPDAAEIVNWLCNPDELDTLLRGTPYAVMIDPAAGPQRSGVLASLNMVADALQLLPKASTTSARWSATTWSTTRRGWLFFTNTPETRTRLVPLTSLWLDLLVLRLMNQQQEASQRAWFVIDELASLQRLPQLHTAMTEARKSNNPLVLGFQGRSQMAQRYGLDAEAMLSQPATKIFLRTSEPAAAKWVSETLGDVEIERLRQSRSTGERWASTSRHSTSYGLERQVEPLVLPSEIGGLPNLSGYLKLGNLVTPLRVPYLLLPARHPKFIPRADAATAGTPRFRRETPAPTAPPAGQAVASAVPAAARKPSGAAHYR